MAFNRGNLGHAPQIEADHASSLGRLQTLWKKTSSLRVSEDEIVGNELRAYYTGTLLNLIDEICELERISAEKSNGELAARFKHMRPNLMGQLQLLSEIGMVLWPSQQVVQHLGGLGALSEIGRGQKSVR